MKTFYASRSAARASGLPVKDAGADKAVKGMARRWYTESLDPSRMAQPVVKADPILQEIFDGAAKHLLKQNAKSHKEGSNYDCRYRGPAGKMCAIGPFIADVHYSEKVEGGTVDSERVQKALKKSGFPVDNIEAMKLAKSLQNVHDYEPVYKWPSYLKNVARQFNLSDAVVK